MTTLSSMKTSEHEAANEAAKEMGSEWTRTPSVSDAPGEARGAGSNEGEGSRSADRRYREGVQRTVREGHGEQDAERARRDVESSPSEYRDAEDEGRSRSAGDAPGDLEP